MYGLAGHGHLAGQPAVNDRIRSKSKGGGKHGGAHEDKKPKSNNRRQKTNNAASRHAKN